MKRTQIRIPSYYSILMILFVFWNSITFVSSEDATDEEYESLVLRLLEAIDGGLLGLSDSSMTRKQAEKIATKLQSISTDPYTIYLLSHTKDDQEKLRKEMDSNRIVFGLLKIVEEIELIEEFFRTASPEMLKEGPEIEQSEKDKLVRFYDALVILAGAGSFLKIEKESEPIMTVADKGYYIITPNAIAAAFSAVAAPALLSAAVSAIGFTSFGIAGGSYAASMMSTAALANGGGVAAGSTVALLQSIGAYGLGFYGTTVAVGIGAVVGVTIASSMYVMSQDHDQTETDTRTSEEGAAETDTNASEEGTAVQFDYGDDGKKTFNYYCDKLRRQSGL